MSGAFVSLMGTAGVEPPVPEGEYQDVGEPQRCRRKQKRHWAFGMRRQSSDQEYHANNQSGREQTVDQETEDMIQSMATGVMGNDGGKQQRQNERRKEPARTEGENLRQRTVKSANRENRDEGRPARFSGQIRSIFGLHGCDFERIYIMLGLAAELSNAG